MPVSLAAARMHPCKVGDLAEIMKGRALPQRYAGTDEPGFVCVTSVAKALHEQGE